MNHSLPLIILQARTGSTRLPAKMTRPFHADSTILAILLSRLRADLPQLADNIVVATTVAPADDAICRIADSLGVAHFRGSECDVLSRFIDCAEHFGAQRIIRICADNVFLDTHALDTLCRAISSDDSEADYISFRKSDGTPSIRTHYGFWAEATTLKALKEVARLTDDPFFHEHVTNYLYHTPGQFKTCWIDIDPEIERHSSLRLTVDTPDDFSVQQQIYADLVDAGKPLTPQAIIAYLESRPDLYDIMQRNIKANSK